MVRTHIKNLGEIALGVPSKGAKTCFFSVTKTACMSATYPALISTIFEIEDVNRCPHER